MIFSPLFYKTSRCALCTRPKLLPTPLCEEHDSDFLKATTTESDPLRPPTLDYTIKSLVSCYEQYVSRKRREAVLEC